MTKILKYCALKKTFVVNKAGALADFVNDVINNIVNSDLQPMANFLTCDLPVFYTNLLIVYKD